MRANLFNSLRLTFLYQTGEGEYSAKIYTGIGFAPRSNLFFLYLPFLTEK